MPPVKAIRETLPALYFAALFHVAVISMLLHAIPKQFERPKPAEPETIISFPPQIEPEPRREKKRRARRAASGTNAIMPYFDPRTFNPQALQHFAPEQRLALALDACAPEKYDMAPDEIRTACSRIGALIANDPEHFGVTTDFAHGQRWTQELIKEKRPILLPCMSPGGVDVLFTLSCVYDLLFDEYKPEKMRHYSPD